MNDHGDRERGRRRARAPDSDDAAFYEALGRAVQVRRTERGIGRRELAERAGVSYPYLSEVETGKKRPSSGTLVALAEALGVPLSELLATAEDLAPHVRPRRLPLTAPASGPMGDEGRVEEPARWVQRPSGVPMSMAASAPPGPSMPSMPAPSPRRSRWFAQARDQRGEAGAPPGAVGRFAGSALEDLLEAARRLPEEDVRVLLDLALRLARRER